MTNFDLIAEAIEMMNAGNNEQAIARLKQFTALNTPKVRGGGKVKIYDWADTKGKKYNPAFMGVYHDAENSVAVATDTHALIVSKPDYNTDSASLIIDKKGDVLKGKFPPYQRVIPKEMDLQEREVNLARVAELLSEMRAEKKINKGVDYAAFNVCDSEHPYYIAPRLCKLLITLPSGKFYLHEDRNRPMLYKSDNGDYTALIMPVLVKSEYIGTDKITDKQAGR